MQELPERRGHFGACIDRRMFQPRLQACSADTRLQVLKHGCCDRRCWQHRRQRYRCRRRGIGRAGVQTIIAICQPRWRGAIRTVAVQSGSRGLKMQP